MGNNLKQDIQIGLAGVIIITIATVAGGYYATHKTNDGLAPKEITTQTETNKATENDKEKEKILDMLESQGVDRSKLEAEYKTKDGATILGDALPVQEFKTLAAAETQYGDFLGLHNKIESLSEYSLIAMHLINNEFLQATYESADEKKTIIVKTSKVKTSTELTSVYSKYKYAETITIENIVVNMSGESADKFQLLSFQTIDNKSYSIHTTYGLSKVESFKLLVELIGNLQLM